MGIAPSCPKRFLHNAWWTKDMDSRRQGEQLRLVYCVFPNMCAAAAAAAARS